MSQGWTEERVGALKKLWLEGQSASQIAKALGGGVTRSLALDAHGKCLSAHLLAFVIE